MNHDRNKIIAGYFPVIHQGYVDLFNKYPDIPVGVFDNSVTSQFDYLRKDVRALEPENAVRLIEGLGTAAFTQSSADLKQHLESGNETIMIDDDISRALAEKYGGLAASVQFESTFLRWDRTNTSVDLDVKIDRSTLASELSVSPGLVDGLYAEAEKSTDWWRFVAAGIIQDGELILTHNRALPTEYTNSIEGDPRITEKRGSGIEKSLFIHAEANLIAHMAKNGIPTKDKELFVTTFPCPNCAKLIAASGFKSCYFIDGYAMLDGQRVLNSADVEIVKVEVEAAPKMNLARLRSYPEKN